jgi:hypothetical protein
MSPPQKWTRQTWIDTATGMVDDGVNLGEVNLQRLLDASGASKNSFYNNFRGPARGDLSELYAEVIRWWKVQRVPAILDTLLNGVQSPVERLRILRSLLAGNAVRDEAMRRWAATNRDVADAVAEGDKAIACHLIDALRELGYQDNEAEDWAEVVVAIIQSVRPQAYETLLRKLDPAAGEQQRHAVGIAPGSVPDELVIYTIAQKLPPQALSQLRANAQQFAESVRAGGTQPGTGQGAVA